MTASSRLCMLIDCAWSLAEVAVRDGPLPIKMKIAPLGLAGGRSYDRTNSLRTPTMKESQLLREKNHFLGLSFNMFKRCACPVSLTCIHTQHQCDVYCLQSKHFRSIAGMIAPPAKIYARDRSRSRWKMKHFRQTANRTRLLAAPVDDLLPVLAVDLLACSRRRHCSLTRDGHQPVMTGHNARRPRTGRERRPRWPPSEAFYLTVWTLNDRFFASRVHCMLRRVLSEYWRKETEKSKVFCGVVGLDGRCSAQAEQRKKPVAVVHLPGAYLSTETNLVSIRGVMKKEFDTGQTDTHTHTQRHGIKAVWTARAPALARTWPPARIMPSCKTIPLLVLHTAKKGKNSGADLLCSRLFSQGKTGSADKRAPNFYCSCARSALAVPTHAKQHHHHHHHHSWCCHTPNNYYSCTYTVPVATTQTELPPSPLRAPSPQPLPPMQPRQ